MSKIEIPIAVKKYEGYTVKYLTRNPTDVIFPIIRQNGYRYVRIGSFEIYNRNPSARFFKDSQRIKLDAPFCFDVQKESTVKELTPDLYDTLDDSTKTTGAKRVNVYICIDSIDELQKLQNIEEEYKFIFKWEESSKIPNDSEIKEAKEQTIKPYWAQSKEDFDFEPLRNTFETSDINSYRVLYSPDDTEGIRLHLGNLIIRNLEKIPCRNTAGKQEQVSFQNLQVHLTLKAKNDVDLPTTVGYISVNDSFVNVTDINILNGQDDISFGVFLDWEKWKNENRPATLFLRIFTDDWKTPELKCKFKMIPQYSDDVYALDLGTTGIVVAKEIEGEQEIIHLDDNDNNPIEPDPEIVSSLTMLIAKDGENEKSKIVLSPSEHEYYGITSQQRFRLVPSKFIIGQERIPYLSNFYQSNEINKTVELFGLDNTEIELIDTNNKEENQEIISFIVGALYKSIFKRFSRETNQIQKLVVTYPNTYSIENLDSIKSILQDELCLNLSDQVSFVLESDAVAAYYFDQKIMNDGGFFDEKGNPKTETNVVIYDMGAGTLDLSLISFKQSSDGSITASIDNKIGIPLAGNYLDFIIYRTLLEKGIIKDLEGQDNTIHGITEGIKYNYVETDTPIKELKPAWYTEYQDKLIIDDTASYKSVFEEPLTSFLECCSKTVLELLIPDSTYVDTIVFSGRASKFSTLRNRVVEALKILMKGKSIKEEKLIPIGKCGDYLKTCVAIGALKYQSFFNNNGLFKIENKNLYSRVAVVYWGRKENKWGVCVEFLIDPYSKEGEDAEFINGTWCKAFSDNVVIKDFLPNKYLYYIQTNLDSTRIEELFKKVYLNDSTLKDDLNWAFINILFKYRINGSTPFSVSLKISKYNKILDRRIGNEWLTDTKLLENIEDNILYRRSMWPFITKLND